MTEEGVVGKVERVVVLDIGCSHETGRWKAAGKYEVTGEILIGEVRWWGTGSGDWAICPLIVL